MPASLYRIDWHRAAMPLTPPWEQVAVLEQWLRESTAAAGAVLRMSRVITNSAILWQRNLLHRDRLARMESTVDSHAKNDDTTLYSNVSDHFGVWISLANEATWNYLRGEEKTLEWREEFLYRYIYSVRSRDSSRIKIVDTVPVSYCRILFFFS